MSFLIRWESVNIDIFLFLGISSHFPVFDVIFSDYDALGSTQSEYPLVLLYCFGHPFGQG